MILFTGHMKGSWLRLFVPLALTVFLQVRVAAGEEALATAPVLPTEITLLGSGVGILGVKEVTAELLARDHIDVSWASHESFTPQDIFEQRGRHDRAAIAVWIDLSARSEARLYFRDSRTDRFFIRSLSLLQGIDEIAKEEIAHIVSNAVLALSKGTGESLSRSEARAALHMLPAKQAVREATATGSPPLRFEGAALACVTIFAREMLLVPGVVASLALTRGPRWGRTSAAFGGWMDFGYQLASDYRGSTVGNKVQSTSLRIGILWEMEGFRMLTLRLGLGAGADRIHYQPQGDSRLVDVAPASSFYVPAVCFWAGLDIRLVDSLALTARVSGDAALAKVHFDLHDSRGESSHVLVPFSVRPGASLGLAFLF